MKFLIALSILVSTTAFAQNGQHGEKIKCYEPAEQGRRGDLAYVLKEASITTGSIDNPRLLEVVYPFQQFLAFNYQSGCLEYPHPSLDVDNRKLSLCPSEGQRINGLVPFEAEYGNDEETVYCEREILRYVRNNRDL